MTDPREPRTPHRPPSIPAHGPRPGERHPGEWVFRARGGLAAYLGMVAVVAVCTVIAELMQRRFDRSNLTMVYLVGVVISAIAFGRGPAIVAAILSVAVFDFAFVPPRFTFEVEDTQYLVTFAVMLLVAIVIGTLTAWLRQQLERARLREVRTAALYRLSHDLAARGSTGDVMRAAAARIGEVLDARVTILLPGADERLAAATDAPGADGDRTESAAARWSYENGELAGAGTAVFPEARGVYVALRASVRALGVLAVHANHPGAPHEAERLHLLRALASQTALALERCRLAEEAEAARMEAEAERTRSALLSSVSHDLRTPLAAITGAASSLRDGEGTLPPATRRELADTISDEAQRLNRLIGNLLELTRIESQAVHVHKEWHSLEEVVGAALARLDPMLADRPVRLDLAPDLPLVPLDDVLFEQVLVNLLENACKFAPAGRAIDVAAWIQDREVHVTVADRGPGLRPGDEQRVFEKFYRGSDRVEVPGFGLGLTVCRGIVAAHGGTIEAATRPGGGAIFTVRLPIEGEPPVVEAESPGATVEHEKP